MTPTQLEIIRLAGDNRVDRFILRQYAPLIETLVRSIVEDEMSQREGDAIPAHNSN